MANSIFIFAFALFALALLGIVAAFEIGSKEKASRSVAIVRHPADGGIANTAL